MIVFLDGQFVAEENAVVSIFDRSFLYGDGLFETVLVHRGRPFRWQQHIDRLQRGAAFLRLQVPFSPEQLHQQAIELIRRNQQPNAILRIHLSRGVGKRGYSPRGADHPIVAITLHPAPTRETHPSWTLITSSLTIPTGQSLTRHKTANKLPYILARAEADAAGADEALLPNTEGALAEGTCSNLFWIENATVCTSPLTQGALDGITRAIVLEICQEKKIATQELSVSSAGLKQKEGVFMTLSSYGIVEALVLDRHPLQRSPLTQTLQEELESTLWGEQNG